MRLKTTFAVACAALLFGAGCTATVETPKTISPMPTKNMHINSPAFADNQPIPRKYTCDGDNTNPQLDFTDVPTETRSLVLLMEDPDVPSTAPVKVWDHWVVYDMPADTRTIPEASTPSGVMGKNTRGALNYGGPCPPDREHRYFFKLYALDTLLGLKEGATKNEVESAMQGHIIDQAELIGVYSR